MIVVYIAPKSVRWIYQHNYERKKDVKKWLKNKPTWCPHTWMTKGNFRILMNDIGHIDNNIIAHQASTLWQWSKLVQFVIRLHQSIVLNVMGKHLSIDSGMAPRLETNLFSQLAREALGSLPSRIMLRHVFDGIWVDVLFVRAHVVYNINQSRNVWEVW